VGPFSQLSIGRGTGCAVATDASAWCWGEVSPDITLVTAGELGNGTQLGSLVPVAVVGGLQFAKIAISEGTTCGLTVVGRAYCWGNAAGLGIGGSGPQLCFPAANGSTAETCTTTPLSVATDQTFTDIKANPLGGQTCALSSSGGVYCWGEDPRFPRTATGSFPVNFIPTLISGVPPVISLAVGYDHACGLTASGNAYCWGANASGQLGDGSLVDRGAPVRVAQTVPFVALAAGTMHTCALAADGTTYCCGLNDNGELGQGTTTGPRSPCQSPSDSNRIVGNCSPLPVLVSGNLHFSSIVSGGNHTCALTPNGDAYCWGAQPGVGTTNANSSVPIHTAISFSFSSLAAGADHTCGITPSGVAYCWGANDVGALGDGSTTNSSTPVKVAGQP